MAESFNRGSQGARKGRRQDWDYFLGKGAEISEWPERGTGGEFGRSGLGGGRAGLGLVGRIRNRCWRGGVRLFRVARRVLYGVVLGRAELYFRILGEE